MLPETIDRTMLRLSKRLEFLRDFSFYLAGGTGLALQIGHRKSFDYDFFTAREFSAEELSSEFKRHKIAVEGEIQRPGTLYCVMEGVKASFIFYDCRLIAPLLKFNTLEVADWRDITTEKLRTVSARGQKKDFYDLYFGLAKWSIDDLITSACKKYGKAVNYFHMLKGITYFDDAERNPQPMLVDKAVAWEEVKSFFVSHVSDFEAAFRRISLGSL